MICLPAVAELEGTPLLVPRPPPPSSSSSSSNVSSLIGTLGGGTCVECDNEEIMEAMMVTTCMMGSVYEFMRTTRDFLVEKGVPARDANHVVARQYWGMTKDALTKSQRDGCQEDSLDQLIQEQTPGGLNEQALRNLDAAGVFDRYKDAMEVVLERIQGQGNTNGS
jgi:Pyrroline-5-carboxylate reductase